MVDSDFELVITSSGDSVTITGVTDKGNGTYEVAGTFTAVEHTLNIKTATNMTTKGYVTTGGVSVTPA